jgi:hypothetical protein
MNDINCPYCDSPQDIDHDDGHGYEENVTHQQQCDNCDKYFVFTTSISFFYDPEKADCLNGSEHIWEKTNTIPREYTRMCCNMCGEERKPTEGEMISILKK